MIDVESNMPAKLLKPFHFKVFFSNKYVHGMVLDKVTNVVVASVASNNHAFMHHLGEKASKNSTKACELLGKIFTCLVLNHASIFANSTNKQHCSF